MKLSLAPLGGGLLLLALVAGEAALGQQPGIAPVAAVAPPAPPQEATKSLLTTFHDGGPVMYPIAVCSFLLVIFVCERFVSLRRGQVVPKPFVTRIFEQLREGQLDREQAIALCEKNGSPVALVLAGGFKKWGRTAVEVEQAVLDSGERVANQLRKYLRLFNGISQVAPLLGLLGTVMGMISSFNAISASQESGQREMMASGIAEALITTAAGMLIAIPALLAYLHFVSRVDQLVTEIDSHGQKLVEMVSADGLERLAQARNPTKRSKAA
ncbi:Biopolymer transport protein ExbB [Anatilimnocola aggregata]|uniref:Biopolymer transport protein ExbB n=1 Tax=Anatilimnocola aggregata TaxID=2528021 RepID=A0A517Y6A5_9BACT|nr:MotA/TolQ/ExbB proton channel family protein [Anatilimnocola aggregata]QDU25761.1 Biopolymer transport protein ExbB [Anatilimnocola aggregata]